MKDDSNLWEDFKKGKEYALSNVYHYHVDFLFNYGKKITTDEDIVLDTIQDIFFDLIRNRKGLGSTDNIRLYLLKSFRRKLIRALKIRQKLTPISYDIEENGFDITFSVEDQIIHDEETAQKTKLISEALQLLNPRQREILYYKFTCGFDYPEICELMSISYDTARQLISRTIQTLKKSIPSKIAPLLFIFLKNIR
ncbi:MAG: RNA polymerase sigma factor [Draconibacterium sp.]